MCAFMIVNNHILLINLKQILGGSTILTEAKVRDRHQKELVNIFEHIEEAIITTSASSGEREEGDKGESSTVIQYQNNKFKDIIAKMKGFDPESLQDTQQDHLLRLKIFKVQRHLNEHLSDNNLAS